MRLKLLISSLNDDMEILNRKHSHQPLYLLPDTCHAYKYTQIKPDILRLLLIFKTPFTITLYFTKEHTRVHLCLL